MNTEAGFPFGVEVLATRGWPSGCRREIPSMGEGAQRPGRKGSQEPPPRARGSAGAVGIRLEDLRGGRALFPVAEMGCVSGWASCVHPRSVESLRAGFWKGRRRAAVGQGLHPHPQKARREGSMGGLSGRRRLLRTDPGPREAHPSRIPTQAGSLLCPVAVGPAARRVSVRMLRDRHPGPGGSRVDPLPRELGHTSDPEKPTCS